MSNKPVAIESAGVVDAQSDLARLGLRLRDTLDTIREAVFQLDPDGRCQFLNAAWTELTGQCISETLDLPIEQFFYPDDRADIAGMIRESLESDHSEPAELRLLKRDGSWIWVELRMRVVRDELGSAIGVSGTLLDIHARRRIQAQLRESEVLFRTAFDLSPNGIAIVNSDARFMQCNRAMGELFGKTAESLLSADFYSLVQVEDLSQAKKVIRRAQTGKTTRGIELRAQTCDGRSIWIEIAASSLSTDTGHAPMVLLQVQDLSERKRIETDLQSQNQILYHAKGMLEAQKADLDQHAEQLQLARQLAEDADHAKTEFLASVSQQMRQAVDEILSAGKTIAGTAQGDDQNAHCVHSIERNGRRLIEALDDMRDLACIETGRLKLEPSEFELKAVAEDAVALIRAGMAEPEAKVSLEFIGESTLRCVSDASRIRQILRQLINVTLGARQGTSANLVIDSTQTSPISGFRSIRFGVCEVGSGERATSQEHGGAVQYGLLLVRRLVELLGGTLTVSDGVGGRQLFVTLNIEVAAKPWTLATPTRPEPAIPPHITAQETLEPDIGANDDVSDQPSTSTEQLPALVARLEAALAHSNTTALQATLNELKQAANSVGLEAVSARAAAAEASIRLAAARNVVEHSVIEVIRQIRRLPGNGGGQALAA